MRDQPLHIGEIRAHRVGRRFEIRDQEIRSLKETILFRRRPQTRELWALRDVTLDVAPGEALGVIGENGSGKSTLLKLFAGIFGPTEGTLETGGRVGSLLELGAGFHPEFTGVENIYLNAAVHGLGRRFVARHLDEILGFAELEEFAHQPVKTYSSGMYMRLGFAVAVHVKPDVMLLDEVLAVGDEPFQQKCYARIWDFRRAGGTIVFVSHDLGTIGRLCDRAILLENGRLVEAGEPDEVARQYHRRLIERASPADRRTTDTNTICRILRIRALDADGAARDRFLEGASVTFELELEALQELRAVNVLLGIREVSGHAIGSRVLPNVDLVPDRVAVFRLHVPALPLREGRFLVDASVTSTTHTVLAAREAALELTVFGAETGAGGPIRLEGEWEVRDPSLLDAAEG